MFAALAMVVGIIVGYVIRKVSYEKQVAEAHNDAKGIISKAKQEAVTAKKRSYFRSERRESSIPRESGR
jgi:ribonuclease Y